MCEIAEIVVISTPWRMSAISLKVTGHGTLWSTWGPRERMVSSSRSLGSPWPSVSRVEMIGVRSRSSKTPWSVGVIERGAGQVSHASPCPEWMWRAVGWVSHIPKPQSGCDVPRGGCPVS